jgi:hypothetical protein
MISPTVQPVPVTATPTIKPTVIPTVLPTPTPTKIITPTPKPTSTPTPVPTNTPIPTSSTGSTITVYAAGTQANQVYPTMRLLINNTVVQTWKGIKGDAANGVYQAFSYQTSGTILPKQIKVQFTNDLYVGSGNDRNLRVDKITINGVDYQTEASTVKSTGSWDPTNGCSIGNKQSEWLQCNGYFQYQ